MWDPGGANDPGGKGHQIPIFTIQNADRQRDRIVTITASPVPAAPEPLQLALFGE